MVNRLITSGNNECFVMEFTKITIVNLRILFRRNLFSYCFFCFDSKKETFDNFFPTNAFAVQASVFQTAKTVKTESVFFKRISLQNTGTGFIDILETFAVIKIEGFGVTS